MVPSSVIALVVVLIVVVTGGSNSSVPPSVKNPHIARSQPIPASMSSSWVQPPAGTPGPETIPVPSGPKLATLLNAATGQTVDGVQCQAGEQTVVHVHTHLTIFVNGKAQVIPYGIGIPGFQAVSTPQGPFVETGSCFYWLHVHANDGIIHIESPSTTETLHPGPVLRRVGHPAQQDAGRAGHREGDGVLHLAGQEAEALHRQPQRHPAG